MEEIALVTAFFDIGRKKWKDFERSSDVYLDHFRFWAEKIKNKLIIYTSADMKEKVIKIRKQAGLAYNTQIIVIEDIFMEEFQIFENIKLAMSRSPDEKTQRYGVNNPECIFPEYNYITMLKPYFVCDAIKRNLVDGGIGWIDFGFNHNGFFYYDRNDLDCMITCDKIDKIHLWALFDLNNDSIFRVVNHRIDYICGAFILANDKNWIQLWDLFQKSMHALNLCDMADDDQTLELMSYRMRPELFEIHETHLFNSWLDDIVPKWKYVKYYYQTEIRIQEVMLHWIKLVQKKIDIKTYFSEKKLKCIALYGALGNLGRELIRQFDNSNVNVDIVSYIDIKGGLFNGKQVILPDDFEFDKEDAMLVATIGVSRGQVQKYLSSRFLYRKIYYLDNVIFELSNQL